MREKNRDRQKVFEIYGKTLNNRIMYKLAGKPMVYLLSVLLCIQACPVLPPMLPGIFPT
jgi:hypothetical protein